MRKLILAALMTQLTFALAQTAKTPAKPATKPAAKPPASAPASTPSTPVTPEEVDSFLTHMFAFQAGATFKTLEVAPDPQLPGITRAVIQLGNQSQVLYIMPGGKFAMVGDVIPFGADPFAPARLQLKKEAHGPVHGAPTAPITLVEFSDLQCPHCKAAQPIIDRLVAESPNVKLIYQPFPLPMHPWALQAAEYAECVAQQKPDAFWKFTGSVYEAQADITEANATEKLNGLAASSGADAAVVATCSQKPEIAAKVRKSIDLGLAVGVGSTPTLFIEGRKVLGISPESLPSLKAMIEYEAQHPSK